MPPPPLRRWSHDRVGRGIRHLHDPASADDHHRRPRARRPQLDDPAAAVQQRDRDRGPDLRVEPVPLARRRRGHDLLPSRPRVRRAADLMALGSGRAIHRRRRRRVRGGAREPAAARSALPDARTSLRSVVREGNVDFEGDTSAETPGSQLIADVLLDDRPGPVFLQLWAGPSTVARALRSIEERFRGSDEWEAVRAAVSAKAVITKFASQDGTFDDYIAPVWPGIRVIEVATLAWGYMARLTVRPDRPPAAERRVDARERHERRPPRCAVPGVGRRAADGAGRYDRLLPPLRTVCRRAARRWGTGLDRPAARRRVDLGGRHHEHAEPARSEPARARASVVRRVGRQIRADLRGRGHVGSRRRRLRSRRRSGERSGGDEGSVVRWFADAQADFAARLRWSVAPRFEDANHHPVLAIEQGIDRDVAAGRARCG